MLGSGVSVIYQGETNECALACLTMILNYHGNHIELAELRTLEPHGQPLSLEQLSDLANHFSLDARALRCEIEDLGHVNLPAIAHMDFDHFVVLQKQTSRTVTIIDPACGRNVLPLRAFSKRFTGILLETQPGADFQSTGTPKDFSPLTFLSGLPNKNLMAALSGLILLSVCIQAFALLSPFYLQVVVDEVLTLNNRALAPVVVISFGLVYLISALTQWFRGLLRIRLGSHLTYLMSAGLFNQLVNLPIAFFSRRNIGDIVSRFGSLKPLQDFVADSAVMILLDLLMIVTTIFMITCYSPQVALFVVLLTLAYLVVQYFLLLPYRAHSHEFLIADANAQTHFIETVQAVDTVKRYQAVNRRQSTWLNKLATSLNAQIRAEQWELVSELSRYLLGGGMLLGVAYLAIDEIILSTLTIGMLYTLMSYSNHFTSAVISISGQWQNFLMLSLHVQRLSDISEHPRDVRTKLEPSAVNKIELKQLGARVPQTEHLLFADVSLIIEKNDKIAITGPSGTGKSTLLALLLGERTPDLGEIIINGRPVIPELDPSPVFSSLRQTDQLLSGTVIDNITYLDPAPDQQRIIWATQLACAHEDIMKLPLAYQENLSEQGCTLSAGQRQRLLLARCLYRAPCVLLLDEGTSHLDEQTEANVMRNILGQPGICLFVTHRDSIAQMADRIINLGPDTPEPEASFAAS